MWLSRWRARRGARPITEEEKVGGERLERGAEEEWRRWWEATGERELRCILMMAWDPVGAGDAPEAWDEYDSYLPSVAERLQGGTDPDTTAGFDRPVSRPRRARPNGRVVA